MVKARSCRPFTGTPANTPDTPEVTGPGAVPLPRHTWRGAPPQPPRTGVNSLLDVVWDGCRARKYILGGTLNFLVTVFERQVQQLLTLQL